MRHLVFVFLFLIFFTMPVFALHPDEILPDPVLESRARDISRQVRCLVCQGEDIDESQAELAGDLRRAIRQRLVAGDSDGDVLKWLESRYGQRILFRPPVDGDTALLWFAPFAVIAGGCAYVFYGRKRKRKG